MPTELSETCALLEWMENRHFTFLGYREYRLQGRKGREALRAGQGERPRHIAAAATSSRRAPTACCTATSAAKAARAI